jgi:hypothetical protein
MIVRSADDIEVETGEVEVGEIRPRAFAELGTALDEEHLLSLTWLALADLAVWPQLPVADAEALARLLETGGAHQLAKPWTGAKDDTALGVQSAVELLPFIEEVDRRVRNHSVDSTINLSPLRLVVNRLAKESGEPIEYWERWLWRVVPAAATTGAERAKALAVAALRCTFAAPKHWKYVASLEAIPKDTKGEEAVRVVAVSAGREARELAQMGVFVDREPVERKITTRFTPAIPVDAYRMGYLFQSVYMTDLLDDEMTGHYDSVTCKNIETGETWSYVRL